MSQPYIMRDYDIFWDNGKWVAVRTGPDGVRRNIAPHNCGTRYEATASARLDREHLNEESPASETISRREVTDTITLRATKPQIVFRQDPPGESP